VSNVLNLYVFTQTLHFYVMMCNVDVSESLEEDNSIKVVIERKSIQDFCI
jgi:hypothetical protein